MDVRTSKLISLVLDEEEARALLQLLETVDRARTNEEVYFVVRQLVSLIGESLAS